MFIVSLANKKYADIKMQQKMTIYRSKVVHTMWSNIYPPVLR